MLIMAKNVAFNVFIGRQTYSMLIYAPKCLILLLVLDKCLFVGQFSVKFSEEFPTIKPHAVKVFSYKKYVPLQILIGYSTNVKIKEKI